MKVAIAGFGLEGISNYKYYKAQGGHDITIVDENRVATPPGVKFKFGDDVFDYLDHYDLVMRSAGIAPSKIRTDGKIWSATNEFFAKCPAPIIGVTGTKGKGTTASLTASILQAAGRRVHLVGNIGVPALDVLKDVLPTDIVIYELSSFQLWDVEKSPQLAVVLMIEPDHLDVHTDMTEYLDAKVNIVRFQGANDLCLYHPNNDYSQWIAQAAGGVKARYGVPDDGRVYVHDGKFCQNGQIICSTSLLKIPGHHNLENACAAISAALCFTQDITTIELGLSSFTGLPHRLKYVDTVRDVEYYDDSIATTPGSAIAAMNSFSKPKVLILGGSDKGAEYHDIIKLCQETGTKVVAIGDMGSVIAENCRIYGVEHYHEPGGMPEIVKQAAKLATPGSVVILSPAAASFDQYKNYADRGDQFIAAVEAMKLGANEEAGAATS